MVARAFVAGVLRVARVAEGFHARDAPPRGGDTLGAKRRYAAVGASALVIVCAVAAIAIIVGRGPAAVTQQGDTPLEVVTHRGRVHFSQRA